MNTFLIVLLIFFGLVLVCIWLKRRSRRLTWTNWGRNQRAHPKKIFYPKSLKELQHIVREAHLFNINIHAFGTGHSWSNLVPTSGFLINTDHLNALLEVNLEKKQVRVEAGIKLHDLNTILDEHGLALSNLGRVAVQSIAGVTATGTHGTGHTPTLSSFITKIELLTDDGTLKVISAKENAEFFSAARLSLGSLGIIYALTLQCEAKFVLESRCEVTEFHSLISNYKTHLQKHHHWMCEWNPYTGKALSYSWDRTHLPATKSFWSKLMAGWHEAVFDISSILLKPFPRTIPALIDMRFRFTAHAPTRSASYKTLTRPYLGLRYVECELSIKPELLSQAIEVITHLFKEHQAEGIYVPRVTFRFVAEEKGTLLSPTYDGDRVFISFVMPAHSAFKKVFTDYQAKMAPFHARPHWGKIHKIDHALALHLYGDNLTKFLRIRAKLDPQGIFLNKQIKSISE